MRVKLLEAVDRAELVAGAGWVELPDRLAKELLASGHAEVEQAPVGSSSPAPKGRNASERPTRPAPENREAGPPAAEAAAGRRTSARERLV